MTEYRVSVESPRKNEGQRASAAITATEAERLLASDPAAAEARARTFLTERPGNGGARLLLGAALRRQSDFTGARGVLESLTQIQPDLILAHYELGLVLGEVGEHSEAIRALMRAIDLMPNFAQAWYALAEQLNLMQSSAEYDTAKIPEGHKTSPHLRDVQETLRAGRLSTAETLLRDFLAGSPADKAARFLLSIALLAQEKGHQALPMIEKLLMDEPSNPHYRDLRAAALFQMEEFEEAIAQYKAILIHSQDRPGAWMSYGRALRALGRKEQCVAAFKRAIELFPEWIEAYRTLASVKSYQFTPAEVEALRTLLACSDLPAASYAELHFALGKVSEDAGHYADAFDNYQRSQALQRANIAYGAEASTRFIRRELALHTASFLRERAGVGCQSAAPIFVVGMPRAGSTLVQEILCAHSGIERTGELRDLTWITAQLDQESAAAAIGVRYPEVLRTYSNDRFKLLGEEYLQRTLSRRKLGRPFFVDKYPGNFYRTGLIHLILPNAKIVDVRRHPLDCCLSCFKNYFPEGQPFSHSLSDLGRYYADYVELMAHFDSVLPGKIHRLFYEELVENPEREVRRLLGYLNLPFEEECLRFYEREQAVMTSSSEQVRVPIYKTGIGTWRHYEKWIDPLRAALGRVLDVYPEVPKFSSPMQISMTMRLA